MILRNKMKKLLILGGTGDAAKLAAKAIEIPGLQVISSLAGRTQQPTALAGAVRIGGFGGEGGLIEYLRSEQIDIVIDATHPFAAQISWHGFRAAEACGLPWLRFNRPGWQQVAGDRWLPVASHQAAAALLPGLAQRVFLTIGRQELGNYAHLRDIWFLMRSIDQPVDVVMPPGEVILAKGPFNIAAEKALLIKYGIEAIVSKNSGGDATYGKIAAARELGLAVVNIERPVEPVGDLVTTLDAADRWLRQVLTTH
jgi:precorrin-6A/cobalt-precorrin-6A reductase